MTQRPEDDRPCKVVDAHSGSEWPEPFPDLTSARACLKQWREIHARTQPDKPFHPGIVWADEPKKFDEHTGRFYWEVYAQYPVGWGVDSAVPKVEWRPRVAANVLADFTNFCRDFDYDRPRAVRTAVERFGRGERVGAVPTNQRYDTTKLPIRIEPALRVAFESKCKEMGLWYSVALTDALLGWMSNPDPRDKKRSADDPRPRVPRHRDNLVAFPEHEQDEATAAGSEADGSFRRSARR